VAERALTLPEVAAEYRVGKKTIYRWLKLEKNPLRGIKLPGGDWRFRREHLDDFDRCRDTSSSDQTIASGSEESSGPSTTPTRSPVALDAFRRGRESGPRPRSGGTNG
jgi:excisionase family DNA binding protein